VKVGTVKRLVFLAGIVVLFLGALILMDPVVDGDHNCGTALIPKQFVQSGGARRCAAQIARRRWLGAAVVVVGALAVIVPGPRCLLVDD
jgi:hypothetical protein